MPLFASIDPIANAKSIEPNLFGVVLKSTSVPLLENGSRDWSLIDAIILESGATTIRYPGGTEGWRDFDFTDASDIENLKAVIDFCGERGLDLQFTVSLRQFFVEPANSDVDGTLQMTSTQRSAFMSFLKKDLLDYATSRNVNVVQIQLDNEPLHRDFEGEFLNHREYGILASTYAEMVGRVVSADIQSPEIIIVTASGAGNFDQAGNPSFSGAWGIRAIINGIAGTKGASYIDGIDLHMGDVTLHPEYEDIFGTDADASPFLGADLSSSLAWQIDRWTEDAIERRSGIDNLTFNVSAWSYPQAKDGGSSLANAGLGVLHMHAYSIVGITSATNYTLIGGDANALFSKGGVQRPGGAIFGMMAESLVGLAAVDISSGLSNSQRASSTVITEGFANEDQLVLYVINRTDEQQSLDINLGELTKDFAFFTGGIAQISGRTLGVVSGDDPTSPYARAEIRLGEHSVEPLNFKSVSVTLDAYEVIELSAIANRYVTAPRDGGGLLSPASVSFSDVSPDQERHFLDSSGYAQGGPSGDIFTMGNGTGYVHGDEGHDILSFANSPNGIDVFELHGIVENRENVVKFDDIEEIHGTPFGDRFVIHGNNKSFFGSNGNDTFISDSGSNNVIRGGSGSDTIIVNGLDRNSFSGGSGSDVFIVNSGTNFISGGRNSDTIVLNGGQRNILHYSAGDGVDSIYHFREGRDYLTIEGLNFDPSLILYGESSVIINFSESDQLVLHQPSKLTVIDDIFLA